MWNEQQNENRKKERNVKNATFIHSYCSYRMMWFSCRKDESSLLDRLSHVKWFNCETEWANLQTNTVDYLPYTHSHTHCTHTRGMTTISMVGWMAYVCIREACPCACEWVPVTMGSCVCISASAKYTRRNVERHDRWMRAKRKKEETTEDKSKKKQQTLTNDEERGIWERSSRFRSRQWLKYVRDGDSTSKGTQTRWWW